MRKFNKTYLLFSAVAISLAACDDIEVNERFVELPPIEGDMVVLLEDYTGQICTNCYEGHVIIEQLTGQYPDKVVAVSIHAGEFAIPASNASYVGLKQTFGDDMARSRNISEYPSGAVNGDSPLDRFAWAAAVRSALESPARCEISIGGFGYDADSRELSGNVSVIPGYTVPASLGIWIVEDGIVARQYNVALSPEDDGYHKWDFNYVHNHVLRAYATNSVWGDPISLNRDEEATRDFSVVLDPSWNIDNISVVAFVTDASTGTYLQTAQARISLPTD